MNAAKPSTFYPELTDDRLRQIAVKLLDLRFSTIREMNSPFDDNYTRETAVFGRSKNMLVEMAMSRKHDWMTLSHAGMDVTFNIERVPCRFFRDDHSNPEKPGFFKRNAWDELFETDEQQPVMWRFVVEKAISENDEDRVFFIGYNALQEKISEWMYQASAPTLHTVDKDVPASAEIPPAAVDVREEDSEIKNGNLKTGSDE